MKNLSKHLKVITKNSKREVLKYMEFNGENKERDSKMKTYELILTTKEISKWIKNKGQGDFVKIVGLNKSIKFETDLLTISDIANALNKVLGFEIDVFDLSFENEQLAYFDVIENEKGFKCDKGSFLAEYDFKIKLGNSELNLEKLFG